MCSGPTWLFPPSRTVLQENTADWWKKYFEAFLYLVIWLLHFYPDISHSCCSLWIHTMTSVERRCLWSSVMMVFGQKFRMRSAQGSSSLSHVQLSEWSACLLLGKHWVLKEWLTALTSCHLLLPDLSYSLLRKSRYRTFIYLLLFIHFNTSPTSNISFISTISISLLRFH